jgi:hypothetical protein
MSSGAQPAQVNEDTPLRLEQAVKLAFPFGGMTVSGLRRERAKGNIGFERMANKDYVTLRAIKEMRDRCRDKQKEPGSGLNPKSETQRASSKGAHHGSFETERKKSALDALRETARGLSKPSRNISPENTKCRATADVIHLKS